LIGLLLLKKKIFFQTEFEKYKNFHLDLAIYIYLLNLAILPQGVNSGEFVFVLPPCG
jgi:hypothetical protein